MDTIIKEDLEFFLENTGYDYKTSLLTTKQVQ